MSNCLCQFWNEKSIPLQIFHNFSVSLHITPLKIFSSCIFYFGQNDPVKVPIFTLSNVLVKIYQIPCVIFETTKSVFLQILHDSSLSLKITLLYLFWSNFAQKGQITVEILENWVLGSKFTKFLSFLKEQTSFSSNFASLFQYHEI